MSDTLRVLIIICPLVFVAGFIDSAAGGGGLISLPAYMAAGLPPHMATGTNKCSSMFGTVFSTWNFFKSGKIHIKTALASAAAALAGSWIGAMLNMIADEKILRMVLLFTVPVVAFFIVFKRDFGKEDRTDRHSQKGLIVISMIIGFVVGCYDGFFGPGTGTFLILGFTMFAGFDLLTASGNAKAVNLASNIAAFVTFAASGHIIWHIGLPAAVFGVAGNILGSKIALKKGSKFIRPMFIVILSILFVKIFIM
ncbi:TSUP family transporter [Lachnospiraceae bacterium NSJ-143]|nr:TSUP family transporter [Lachnospiraceae bacterium NSJ-143]